MTGGYVPPEHIPGWVSVCATLAPVSSILMFLSPIPTIRQIVRTGHVGDLPLLPYTSMVTSSFVWILYGLLRHEPTLWSTNVIECVVSLYYGLEFTHYAPVTTWSPTLPGTVLGHLQFCAGTSMLSLLMAVCLPHATAVSLLGLWTVLLTTLTFASPLAALHAVWETQSADAIPGPFAVAAAINGGLWAVTGVWDMHDGYVAGPAMVGWACAMVQVALKVYFGYCTNENYSHAYERPSSGMTTSRPQRFPWWWGKVRQCVLLGDAGNGDRVFDSGAASSSLLYHNADELLDRHDLMLHPVVGMDDHRQQQQQFGRQDVSIVGMDNGVDTGVPMPTHFASGTTNTLPGAAAMMHSSTGGGTNGVVMMPSMSSHHPSSHTPYPHVVHDTVIFADKPVGGVVPPLSSSLHAGGPVVRTRSSSSSSGASLL